MAGRPCLIHTLLCQGIVMQYSNLIAAMQEEGKQFEVRWHPFQLNPGASQTVALAVLPRKSVFECHLEACSELCMRRHSFASHS